VTDLITSQFRTPLEPVAKTLGLKLPIVCEVAKNIARDKDGKLDEKEMDGSRGN